MTTIEEMTKFFKKNLKLEAECVSLAVCWIAKIYRKQTYLTISSACR